MSETAETLGQHVIYKRGGRGAKRTGVDNAAFRYTTLLRAAQKALKLPATDYVSVFRTKYKSPDPTLSHPKERRRFIGRKLFILYSACPPSPTQQFAQNVFPLRTDKFVLPLIDSSIFLLSHGSSILVRLHLDFPRHCKSLSGIKQGASVD
jgi:hypothetical protein